MIVCLFSRNKLDSANWHNGCVCVLKCNWILPWCGNCGCRWGKQWSRKCAMKLRTWHVTNPAVAHELTFGRDCHPQTQAQWGSEGPVDGHSECHDRQWACLHVLHSVRLGEDMCILGEREHEKSFGACQWNVMTTLMTSCRIWDSGNHCRCPQTETFENSVCVTGNHNWNKWWGSPKVVGYKNSRKDRGEQSKGCSCVCQAVHPSACWKGGQRSIFEGGLWAKRKHVDVLKTHTPKEGRECACRMNGNRGNCKTWTVWKQWERRHFQWNRERWKCSWQWSSWVWSFGWLHDEAGLVQQRRWSLLKCRKWVSSKSPFMELIFCVSIWSVEGLWEMNTWHKVANFHIESLCAFLESPMRSPMRKGERKFGNCVTRHLVESMSLWQIVVWFASGVNSFWPLSCPLAMVARLPVATRNLAGCRQWMCSQLSLSWILLSCEAENVWTPRGWVANPSRLHSNPSSTPCATRPICTQMMARIAQTDRCHWRWLTPYAPGQILPQVRQSSIDECCMHSLSAVDTLPHSSSQSFATEEMGKVWMMEDERSKKTGEAMLMWRMKQGLQH